MLHERISSSVFFFFVGPPQVPFFGNLLSLMLTDGGYFSKTLGSWSRQYGCPFRLVIHTYELSFMPNQAIHSNHPEIVLLTGYSKLQEGITCITYTLKLNICPICETFHFWSFYYCCSSIFSEDPLALRRSSGLALFPLWPFQWRGQHIFIMNEVGSGGSQSNRKQISFAPWNSMRMGFWDVVVVTDYDMAKEALNKDEWTDRPPFPFLEVMMKKKQTGLHSSAARWKYLTNHNT